MTDEKDATAGRPPHPATVARDEATPNRGRAVSRDPHPATRPRDAAPTPRERPAPAGAKARPAGRGAHVAVTPRAERVAPRSSPDASASRDADAWLRTLRTRSPTTVKSIAAAFVAAGYAAEQWEQAARAALQDAEWAAKHSAVGATGTEARECAEYLVAWARRHPR